MRNAVIVGTSRTPIGRAFKGSLKDIRPDDLLIQSISAVLAGVPDLDPRDIEDIVVGCGSPAGTQGFNIARVAAVALGLDTVPGMTLNRYCASSLQSTRMALHAIRAGEGDVFISAGVESCSSYPTNDADAIPGTMNPIFDTARERSEQRIEQNPDWFDPRAGSELPDVYLDMGQTAENVASMANVSRAEADAFALLSHQRAFSAQTRGFWAKDITPLLLPDGTTVSHDDSPRPDTTLDRLAGLKPAFRPGGISTAGNSCPLSDGAASLVIMSEEAAKQRGIKPLARIIATGVSALSPEIMGLGPVEATRQALKRARMTIGDIDCFEINEAFAAQAIPSIRELDLDMDRVNINGGAIALGHPFGSTGARLTTTLLHTLEEQDKEFGLESMCVAGGQGMALLLQRLS